MRDLLVSAFLVVLCNHIVPMDADHARRLLEE